jgi:putative Mg2+ transporter-C (MgtC) family protein
MPTDAELALRLAAALVLGGAIGLEREVSGQVAGLRTHMMVALGSCLFGVVSAYGFGDFIGPRADTNLQVDVTRVASNIVTGVGFLGGGAILKSGASVKGLTTAASLWVTAAVGLGVAFGSLMLAAVTTFLLVFALTALRAPRHWLRQRFVASQESVSLQLRADADPAVVIARVRALPNVEVASISLRDNDDETTVEAALRGPRLDSYVIELAALDEVVGVSVGTL